MNPHPFAHPLDYRDGELCAEKLPLSVMSAGAYGMAMSSNYNSRPRAAEVMVDGGKGQLVRRREDLNELFALETILS